MSCNASDRSSGPEWSKLEAAFRGIWERRYFANNGPLVRALDAAFADTVGSAHAVAVTNECIGLMILAKGLELSGEVIVPAFGTAASLQALQWADLTPVLCDVDPLTHGITAELVRPLVTKRTTAIVGLHMWGRACDPEGLQELSEKTGVTLLFDARHAVGCSHNERSLGTFGSGEVFSFHESSALSAAEGGCITTNDEDLAKKLRTIRSFHPGETFAAVGLRVNGKMSEAQAALALISLEDLSASVAANRERYEAYVTGLRDVPGIRLVRYDSQNANNFAAVVAVVEESSANVNRDELRDRLIAENVRCRTPAGVNGPFPTASALARTVIQLPNEKGMSPDEVRRICELIRGGGAPA